LLTFGALRFRFVLIIILTLSSSWQKYLAPIIKTPYKRSALKINTFLAIIRLFFTLATQLLSAANALLKHPRYASLNKDEESYFFNYLLLVCNEETRVWRLQRL